MSGPVCRRDVTSILLYLRYPASDYSVKPLTSTRGNIEQFVDRFYQHAGG